MKYLYIIIAVVVLGGAVFLMGNKANAPAAQDSMELRPTNEVSKETEEGAAEFEPVDGISREEDAEISNGTTEESAVSEEKVFTLDSFKYGYSIKEIRVKKGDEVTIKLTSSDGMHDWVVDEFGAYTNKINAGETSAISFVASEAGTFEYYCSVGDHRAQGMVGKLIVE
ncbi:MAG: hypothetical protein RLZZ230_363 [Candidatus Parcubacteria bacterium]|jgi:plastocyanin